MGNIFLLIFVVWKDIKFIGTVTITTKRRKLTTFGFDLEICWIHNACHVISSDIITKMFMNPNSIPYINTRKVKILDTFNFSKDI